MLSLERDGCAQGGGVLSLERGVYTGRVRRAEVPASTAERRACLRTIVKE